MLSARQELILETLVDEYIRKAFPISSDFLKQEGEFNCSTATLRNELAELASSGYLEKTHVSGGRIPTDKGYRFFVDRILEQGIKKEKRFLEELNGILKNIEDLMVFSQEVAKILAEFSGELSIVSFDKAGIFWKEGWENIVGEPEFQNIKCWKNFIQTINEFEKASRNKNFLAGSEKSVKIFIGKELPLGIKEFSAVIGRNNMNGAVFAILGPKRMNFGKNIGLIEAVMGTYII